MRLSEKALSLLSRIFEPMPVLIDRRIVKNQQLQEQILRTLKAQGPKYPRELNGILLNTTSTTIYEQLSRLHAQGHLKRERGIYSVSVLTEER